MLKIAVCVSGGGTNLQAIMDAIDNGTITNTQISVVISNNPGAYALERAKNHGIEAICISPKDYESREAFNEDFLRQLDRRAYFISAATAKHGSFLQLFSTF